MTIAGGGGAGVCVLGVEVRVGCVTLAYHRVISKIIMVVIRDCNQGC